MFETQETGVPLGLYPSLAVCAGGFQAPSHASIRPSASSRAPERRECTS